MKLYCSLGLILILNLFLTSCEEVIDVSLNTTDPKYVIEASLDDISNTQIIKISQTVNFDEPYPSKPIEDAKVVVLDPYNRLHTFKSIGDGVYRNDNFKPRMLGMYALQVLIDENVFLSSTEFLPYVDVDSIGIVKEKMFNEDYYFIKFKFQDPIEANNYYKYSCSVNNGPFRFLNVFSDKYNNGLYVSHEITNFDQDNKFIVGDSILVRRECISKDVYTFWNELQSINPGNAAPANPKSNISNGALGYFSVSSAKLYKIVISEEDLSAEEEND